MVMTETPPYPLILPLADAAREMGVDEATLRDMVKLGKIRAFVDPEGVMYVQMTQQGALPVAVAEDTPRPPDDDINARLRQIRREDFAHLEGQAITVSEAAKKYGVPLPTLYRWIRRGFLTILKQKGRRKFLDEASVAYCAEIYNVRKPFGTRAPLLETDGTPYLLRKPELAQLRRMSRAE